MLTRLHLLSMPMHDPLHPSTQLGYLHGHIERAFGESVDVRSYSGHTQILFDLEGAGMAEYFGAHRLFGEELFFLACCQAYPRLFGRVYPRYLDFPLPEVHVSREHLEKLGEVMRAYLRTRVLPALAPGVLNVIGMTTTFAQVFASIFAAQYLREHSDAQLLFVFGGSSMALPEANRVLHLWGVSGLLVTGAGEAPLQGILDCCLELDPEQGPQALEHVLARGLSNVNQIGTPTQPINLSLSRRELAEIGDPNYDEFFANLGSLCATQEVYEQVLDLISIPLEGSRGCFAKCDFCQNPNITTQFRTLTGHQVAARARRLVQRHRVPRVYFADSVCNSWAEDYADDLLATGDEYGAFMEMRVHATESFFTKLALAGVNEMQLGIEAVSGPLLEAMQKGTTVLQNLRAAKYLAELGVESASNLITHHPKSTVADIAETKRIVELVGHFPRFCLSRFVISYASPIYNALSPEQQAQLIRGFTWLPEDLQEYSIVRDLAYPYPTAWLDPEVHAGWSEFRQWYQAFTDSSGEVALDVEERDGGLNILDTRFGATRQHRLVGELARVFELCHAGPTRERLVSACGLDPAGSSERADGRLDGRVDELLEELIERALVIELDGRYLSLALRPRAQVIAQVSGARRLVRARHSPALAVLEEGA